MLASLAFFFQRAQVTQVAKNFLRCHSFFRNCYKKMCCFFCGSKVHITQDCMKYISDEPHQNAENNGCHGCFYSLSKVITWFCFINKKCSVCFLSYHHTLNCKNRLNGKYFLENQLNF